MDTPDVSRNLQIFDVLSPDRTVLQFVLIEIGAEYTATLLGE